MTWRIVSTRVGVPGARFTPPPGTNIQALLDNGFIEPDNTGDTSDAPRRRKVRNSTQEE